ncbi:MAG: response regulator [Treponema sp.]
MYKVLIVEDEELIRKGLIFTTNWLALGCTVVGEAGDGEEGLEKIYELAPDIVIADICMPVLSGLEMIQKAQEAGKSFYPIILSSYSDFEYARMSIHLGVFEYLLKPIDERALALVIARIAKQLDEKAHKNAAISGEISILPDIPDTKENFFVTQTIKYVQQYYNKPITIQMVAADLKVSVSYLSRKIKKITNRTFLDILNSYRITRAVELLRTGQYRIYEVADMTGFINYKYFSAVFKRYTGYSPSSLVHFS